MGTIHLDVAAVIVQLVLLASFLVRRKTHTPTNRVYMSVLLLTTLTACAELAAELAPSLLPSGEPSLAKCLLHTAYYTLRVLVAPAYLVLIATVSGTGHRLSDTRLERTLLWGPMLAVGLFAATNHLHHLVRTFQDGASVRGPFVWTIYACALYYSLWGIYWLVRWRKVLNDDELATLASIYPIMLVSVVAQFLMPNMRLEMFATSICMMLMSSFVMRPERHLDTLVGAASMQAYRDMCNRAFATQKPLCLVYLEIVEIDRLRELLGKDKILDVMGGVARNLSRSLRPGDALFYLRNGMFCIAPVSTDANRALAIAEGMHEEGRRRALSAGGPPPEAAGMGPASGADGAAPPSPGPGVVQMRTCVVRIPQDAHDHQQLRSFVRRFSHLVPHSSVTTFAELSRRDDFALNMALSEIVEKAIRNRSFSIHYQPIRCMHDGKYHSAEALVRLHDPTFGWIPPALFIPEAEQSGAIVDIGSIVLERICDFLSRVDFDATGLDYVEVNLSVEQCMRPQLSAEVLGLIREYDVDPRRMNLEITESLSASSQAIMERNVRTLVDAGVSFSLDDYGTGYSNLTRALSLPFGLVKFDKSFVDGLDDPAMGIVLERSISMMHEVGKGVLIEGVETQDQAKMLSCMGVDYMQGYLYTKPLAEDEFVSFLCNNNRTQG